MLKNEEFNNIDDMKDFFSDLVSQENPIRRSKKRGRKKTRKQKEQEARATAIQVAEQEEVDRKSKKRADRKRKVLEEKQRVAQRNADIAQKIADTKAANAMLPDNLEDLAKLFILADIFGKPPPGLS